MVVPGVAAVGVVVIARAQGAGAAMSDIRPHGAEAGRRSPGARSTPTARRRVAGQGRDPLPPVPRERLGLTWTPRQERTVRRVARLVRGATALVPPPPRIAPTMAVAYWNTYKPGTDRWARRPLGAA